MIWDFAELRALVAYSSFWAEVGLERVKYVGMKSEFLMWEI